MRQTIALYTEISFWFGSLNDATETTQEFFCQTQIFPGNHLVDLDGTSDARDCHMTIAYDINNTSLIIQDGAKNADVRQNKLAEKVTLVYHRTAN